MSVKKKTTLPIAAAVHPPQQLPACVEVQTRLAERLENSIQTQERNLETQERLAGVVDGLVRAQLLFNSRLEMLEKRQQDEDAAKKKLAEEERAEVRDVRGDRRKFGWQTVVAVISSMMSLITGVLVIKILELLGQPHP